MKKIGWIGTGTMGEPMVLNLLKNDFEVVVYNRTVSKLNRLLSAGAESVSQPKDLWDNCDIVFIMVTNAQACKSILTEKGGLLDIIDGTGKVIFNSSTIGINSTKELSDLAKAKGIHYFDTPVSGSAGAAKEGTLLFLLGGAEQNLAPYETIFNAMGKKNYFLGNISAGNKAKLAINYLIAINYLAIGETVHFAENIGIDPADMMDIIDNSGAGNITSKMKTGPIVKNDFSNIAFALDNMLKDIRLASDAGNDQPLMESLKDAFTDASEKGYGKKDVMEIINYLRHDYRHN